VRRREEFLAIQREGRRTPCGHFLVVHDDRGSDVAQLGVTVTRKIGNAVARNHIKRSVREAFRARRAGLRSGVRLVVIARDGAARLSATKVADELDPVLSALCGRLAP
jgi:ribonuclease P protein component